MKGGKQKGWGETKMNPAQIKLRQIGECMGLALRSSKMQFLARTCFHQTYRPVGLAAVKVGGFGTCVDGTRACFRGACSRGCRFWGASLRRPLQALEVGIFPSLLFSYVSLFSDVSASLSGQPVSLVCCWSQCCWSQCCWGRCQKSSRTMSPAHRRRRASPKRERSVRQIPHR